jgi:hypothetical protein
MGIPVPGDELATLEIPAKPQQPEKPKAEEKPVLSRNDAEKFASDSKYSKDVYHATTSENADKIRSEGFAAPNGSSFGAMWGNGVYVATDKASTDYYRRTMGMTDKAETMTLKARIKNPIKFDASNVESPEEGAEKIAEQIGQSHEYNSELKRINATNTKLELEAAKKFGRPLRTSDRRKGESNDTFLQRYEDQRRQYSDFMAGHGYVDNPSGEALTRIASSTGYDAIIINDREFRPEVGGNQIVVFDPNNIKVIEEGNQTSKPEPEPETWYESEKYQRSADKMLSNLKNGKISISDAERAHAAKTKEFMDLSHNRNRSGTETQKMQKISNELGAMQYALNRFTQGEPDARRRHF